MCGTIGTFHHEGFAHLKVIAVFRVEIVHQCGEGFALTSGISSELGKHNGGAITVLVSDAVGAQVAVAFFTTKDEEARILKA